MATAVPTKRLAVLISLLLLAWVSGLYANPYANRAPWQQYQPGQWNYAPPGQRQTAPTTQPQTQTSTQRQPAYGLSLIHI